MPHLNETAHGSSHNDRRPVVEKARRSKLEVPHARTPLWWLKVRMTHNERKVLEALAYFAGPRHESFPNVQTIADITDVAPNKAYIALDGLCKKRLITKLPGRNDRRRRMARTYIVHFDPPADVLLFDSPESGLSPTAADSPKSGLHDSPELGLEIVPNREEHPDENLDERDLREIDEDAAPSSSGGDDDDAEPRNDQELTDDEIDAWIDRDFPEHRARAFCGWLHLQALKLGLVGHHIDVFEFADANHEVADVLLSANDPQDVAERALRFLSAIASGEIHIRSVSTERLKRAYDWAAVAPPRSQRARDSESEELVSHGARLPAILARLMPAATFDARLLTGEQRLQRQVMRRESAARDAVAARPA